MNHTPTVQYAVSFFLVASSVAIFTACGGGKPLSLAAYNEWCESIEERYGNVDEDSVADELRAMANYSKGILNEMKEINPPEELVEYHDFSAEVFDIVLRVLDGEMTLVEFYDDVERLESRFREIGDNIPRYVVNEVPECTFWADGFDF